LVGHDPLAEGQPPNRGENNLGYEQAFRLQEYPMPVANTPDF
jgi:hypothetical protein